MNHDTKLFVLTKQRLHNTEEKLKTIMGDDSDCLKPEGLCSRVKVNIVGRLLMKRRNLLNQMFLGTPNEFQHLNRVNDHLLGLITRLYEKTTNLAKSIVKDTTFDDDYEIEGTVRIPYNSEDSVLKLEEDHVYGSDFCLMNSILEAYYIAINQSHIGQRLHPGDKNILDDSQSWDSPPFNSAIFNNITIGYTLHDLCSHKYYSIPDIIRLNDFWAEVKIVVQNLTNQKGERAM